MHSMNQLKQTPLPLRIVFILACFAVLPGAQALLPPPPPDGGYINENTAEGDYALYHLTSGAENTAVGRSALTFLTSGNYNTAVGSLALENNTTGSFNTAIGTQALYSLTSGQDNTAVGMSALVNTTSGNFNTANGFGALLLNTTGIQNTATGAFALQSNTIANNNTADGFQALRNNTRGSNTAIGSKALLHNSTGSFNIGLGVSAGANLTTGSNNIAIGNYGVAAESNTIRIGRVQTRTFIKGISGVAIAGAGVVVNANGQLGVVASSADFKHEIRPMGEESEAILALKPVSFCYDQDIDEQSLPQFGLVAEDVEKVNPDLVLRNEEGKPYSVRYEAVNAMLLNEFLKEHQTVQELKKQVAELTAGLQKLSAQLELNKSAPQTVLNNP